MFAFSEDRCLLIMHPALLTAQVLKEYEKTISELIADKERDKKALEAEVQLLSLMRDFCFHGNLAFTCFFYRC